MAAITRYGLPGPMGAYGNFSAKTFTASGGGNMLMLMGVSSWIFWFLISRLF